jgi:hypothetical protein
MASADAQNMALTTGLGSGGGFRIPGVQNANMRFFGDLDDHGSGPGGGANPDPSVPTNPAPVPMNAAVAQGPGQGILPQARGVANQPFPGVPPSPMANGSILPQARGVAVPPTLGQGILPQARGAAVQPGPMAPGNSTMAGTPAVQPAASGGATANGATSNPRFGTVQYQTPNSVGARSPIYTAMNRFGGMPQGAPSATPRAGVPGANAPPRVAGPMAQGGGAPDFSNLPDDIFGPDYRSMGDTPDVLAATRRKAAAQLAAASLKQRYG